MPKQVQFTKEIIIKAAIEILRSDGIDALTARSLSRKLGCSTRFWLKVFSANPLETSAEL